MSCAQTGSGKTAAFLLPIIDKVIKKKAVTANDFSSSGRGNGFGGPTGFSGGSSHGFGGGFRSGGGFGGSRAKPIALILAPTRELAQQIENECRKFTFGTRVTCAAIFGGAPSGPQIARINGADIIIATPGRFSDFRERGVVEVSGLEFFVLDEADRMLDVGFGPAINQIVQDSTFPSNDNRQTLLFSATFPRSMQGLARSLLKPQHLFLTVGRIGSASELVKQTIVLVKGIIDKEEKLIQLLEENTIGKTLIFCRTKDKVDEVGSAMERMGHKVVTVHGGFSQSQRNYSVKAFTNNQAKYLVATDVAARGLDIKDIETVINFDLPTEIDDYVHRIGRTGRAGREGKSIAFFDARTDGKLGKDLIQILQDAKQEVPSFIPSTSFETRRSPSRFGSDRGPRSFGGSRSNYGRDDGPGSSYGRGDERSSHGRGDERPSYGRDENSSFGRSRFIK